MTWNRRHGYRSAMLVTLFGASAVLAIAQPAQTPQAPKQDPKQVAKGQATLTARLVEGDMAMPGAACVEVQTSGVQLVDPATTSEKAQEGQGHLHYRIDDGPTVATTATKLAFYELKPGPHKLTVMLAANDHSPLGPSQELAISGDVKPGVAKHGKEHGEEHGDEDADKEDPEKKSKEPEHVAQAKEKATLTAKLVDGETKAKAKAATVEVTVTGVTLADPSGDMKSAQAHLNYRVDDGPVIGTSMKKLSFHGLRSGAHKIKVSITSADHAPLGAEQTLDVTIP